MTCRAADATAGEPRRSVAFQGLSGVGSTRRQAGLSAGHSVSTRMSIFLDNAVGVDTRIDMIGGV